MDKVRLNTLSYEVVGQKVTRSRVYVLVKLSLPKLSTDQRKKAMEIILDESSAIGSMEWWTRGSIVKKPKWHFYCILVLKA